MAAAMLKPSSDGDKDDVLFFKAEEIPMDTSHLILYQVKVKLDSFKT